MNPFKSRKKLTKEEPSVHRPSVESETSSGPFRMFGRKKSSDDEVKKEIDISVALPSNDDFRTSLLMTGLSARFSMLREQDDPNTKLGKASDDSVLYPKRQSRMADFGFPGGLGDIAEVESIRAPYARTGSFQSSDDGASTHGGIMNRGKATEGNTLFGGKQRIYKIANGNKSGSFRPILQDEEASQSAFQKWRQSEKDKDVSPDQEKPSDNYEDESNDYFVSERQDRDRRRETNSTISSIPSAARNSTAATSITSSQHGASRDWQANTTASSIASSFGVDRSATRSRRLYEQGLNQDMQEQQSSALSRIDTLSRQRTFGTRTPDLSPMAQSPTGTFPDRGVFDRRPIISKASAPNLRSFSPPTTTPMSPPEVGSAFSALNLKSSFGAAPPLSPPMSETEEQSSMLTQAADRAKGGMTMFSRPTPQYDETKYAQRARQLQQEREANNRSRAESNSRSRAESNSAMSTTRSASLSSRSASIKAESAFVKPEPTAEEPAEEKSSGLTFFDDTRDSFASAEIRPAVSNQESLPRHDLVHPAFRQPEPTSPLPPTPNESNDSSLPSKKISFVMTNPKSSSPEDSPTLGPNTGGLSGMVRQHLRNTSTASSIYDTGYNEHESETLSPVQNGSISNQLAIDTYCLDLTDADWDMAHGHRTSVPESAASDSRKLAAERSPIISVSPSTGPKANEQDDFARHLADGARRVREKLNSYVESDSQPPSPLATPQPEPLKSALRPNPLGILKAKSSRGSLIDRDRNRDSSAMLQPKPTKVLGLDTMSSSPVGTTFKQDSSPLEESPLEESQPDEKENVHAGLKAFRQARRELQRMKEMEVQSRHPAQAPHAPQGPVPQLPEQPQLPPQQPLPQHPQLQQPHQPPQHQLPSPQQPHPYYQNHPQHGQPHSRPYDGPVAPVRRMTNERGPPPSAYNRMPRDESRSGANSRSESRASERDRSGSDTSNGGRSHSRPPRLRTASSPYEEHHAPNGHSFGGPRPRDMLRSPNPPMENKRSPMLPSPGYRVASPGPFGPPGMSPGPYSGRNDFQIPSDPSDGHRPIPARHGSLPNVGGANQNMHSPTTAPPLPPINPRRKNTGGLNVPVRGGEEMNHSAPQSPMGYHGRDKSPGALFLEDNAGPDQYRQRLRKVTSEVNIRNGRPQGMNTSPPRRGPPPPLPIGNHSRNGPGMI